MVKKLRYILTGFAICVVLIFAALFSKAQSVEITNQIDSTSVPYCDSTLWAHVYNSYRLQVKNKCTTVTGKVAHLIYEADGDIHIRLTLDSAYTWMLNDTNRTGQHGDLICEPICATTVTQSDAIAPCSGLKNAVYIPAVGEYVSVTGPYCHDKTHGWNEMHPVTSITIIYHTSTTDFGVEKPLLVIYPNPSTDMVNFHLTQQPMTPVYISIADGLGRNAGQYQMMNSNTLQITTTYLPNGIYYYNITQNHVQYKTGRFVVIHSR